MRSRRPRPSRVSHWTLLSILAMANLIVWVSLAIAVGLLLSDELDIGAETLLRERQATAVAIWSGSPQAVAPVAQPATIPTDGVGPASPSVDNTLPRPGAALSVTPVTAPATATSPPVRTVTSQQATRVAPPTADPGGEQPIAQGEATLESRPLLMADPGIGNMVGMNRAMAESAAGRVVQIRYSEAALNEQIKALLSNNPRLPYHDVYIDLRRDQAVVTAGASVLGFDLDTEVVGSVVADDCLPRMEIESIAIEGVYTPNFVRSQIKALVLEALNWYPPDYPLCLEQIVLEEDRATLYGYRR